MKLDDALAVHVGGVAATAVYLGATKVWESQATGPVLPPATGGTITTATIEGVEYRVHTFAEDGEFVALSPLDVEYFLVGGGGRGQAGKNDGPRGGGAGGQVVSTLGAPAPASAALYSVVVGNQNGSSSFGGVIASGGGNAARGNGGSNGNTGGASGVAGERGGGGAGAGGNGQDGADGGLGGEGIYANPDGTPRWFGRGGDGSYLGVGADNPYEPTPGSGDGSGGRRVGGSLSAHPGGDGIVIIRYRV